MTNSLKNIIITLLLFVTSLTLKSQDSDSWKKIYDSTSVRLLRLEKTAPGLNQKINISITEASLNEFLRAVAKSSDLNMNISPDLTQKVVNNFSDVKISDVLLFLSNQFRLQITAVGNIIDIQPYIEPSVPPVCVINYLKPSNRLTVETQGEELGSLAKKLTVATGINVIPAPGIAAQKVTAFVLELPFPDALDKIAYSNDLVLKSSENNIFLIEKKAPEKADNQQYRADQQVKNNRDDGSKLAIKVLGPDSLNVMADKAPAIDIIRALAEKTGNNYMFVATPKSEVSTNLTGVKFIDALNSIIGAAAMVCKKSGNIYIIGDKTTPNLMTQSMIQLQYRSVDSIMTIIPKDVLSDLQTIEYREQNSLLLSGPSDKVTAAEKFIRSIDKLVPVISIEVLIIDFSSKIAEDTGIEAGIGESAVRQTTGTVYPAVDVTLSSESINNLINRFNGFGWAKIGQVTPNFYLSLQALETQGIVKIRSTPMLSTLNGHKANISIGEKEYYMEEASNIYSTTSTQTYTTKTYKSVTAELSVTITPHVSGDDQITLDIDVEQSDFTARISETAPPGEVTRKFQSQIRVKNGEMILLGGLEENRQDKSSFGTPLLSRIPILKWIFSSRSDSNTKSKLDIFIKPSIIS